MFTAFALIAVIIGAGLVIHWIDSAYEDYKEYYETQDKQNNLR